MDREEKIFSRAFEFIRVRESKKVQKVELFLESLNAVAQENIQRDYQEVPLTFPFKLTNSTILVLIPRESQGERTYGSGVFDVVAYNYEDYSYTKVVKSSGFKVLVNRVGIPTINFSVDGYAAIEIKRNASVVLNAGTIAIVNESDEADYTEEEVIKMIAEIKNI